MKILSQICNQKKKERKCKKSHHHYRSEWGDYFDALYLLRPAAAAESQLIIIKYKYFLYKIYIYTKNPVKQCSNYSAPHPQLVYMVVHM